MKNNKNLLPYEAPTIEIVEFELSDAIALSGNFGGGAIGTESIFGDGYWGTED